MSWLRSTSSRALLLALTLAVSAGGVAAQEGQPAEAGSGMGSGCEAFKWPLERERAAFASEGLEKLAAGAARPAFADQAFALQLAPAAEVSYPLAPARKPKGDGPHYGGVVTFGAPGKPGEYQLTLSGEGWIDLVQNGAAVKSTGHTGARDCPGLRKSVRFAVEAAPVTLQISGAPAASVNVAIGWVK